MKAFKYVIARKEKGGSVAIYKPSDKPLTPASFFCRFDKHNSNKPDYRNKWVVLNCYRYAIMWNKS